MDLELTDSGDGGELIKNQNDLSVIEGFENMIYLAMFGGNIEQSTPAKRLASDQAFDFWGNYTNPGDSSVQFNSETERALNNNPMTSAGRQAIQGAIEKDLEFMSDFAQVTVDTSIVSSDRLEIFVTVLQPQNLQAKEFIYIWNSTNKELTVRS